jgi:hypothetical protein
MPEAEVNPLDRDPIGSDHDLILWLEHDLRANASRLSRGKTGSHFSGSCSEAPDCAGGPTFARGTSARVASRFYVVATIAAVKLPVLRRVNDQFFLGKKLERTVPFSVNGVPEAAVNCRKHGDDRTHLMIVGRIIDRLANRKLCHRELPLESWVGL